MSARPIATTLLVRLLAICGLIISAVPLVYDDPSPFPWKAAGGLVTALIVYLGTYTADYRAWRAAAHAEHPHDLALMKEFLALLPPRSAEEFFERFDFGNAIHASDIAGLNRFADTWSLVDHDFRDKRLQKVKVELHEKGAKLANEIAMRTRPLNRDMLTVKLANTSERTPSVLEDARVINEHAREFSKIYKSFVKVARARLTITNDASKRS